MLFTAKKSTNISSDTVSSLQLFKDEHEKLSNKVSSQRKSSALKHKVANSKNQLSETPFASTSEFVHRKQKNSSSKPSKLNDLTDSNPLENNTNFFQLENKDAETEAWNLSNNSDVLPSQAYQQDHLSLYGFDDQVKIS